MSLLVRFCLYGFLKNQRYFEPFLFLALSERGLSWFEIGLLVGYRELLVSVVEVPSGAVADLYGRRRSLAVCFASYLVGFVLLGAFTSWPGLLAAMTLCAVGDAFRTGSHKALIFTWLRLQGREAERTRIYGLTRSWSKLGSAVSALIAAGLVWGTGSYDVVFGASAAVCLLSLVNLLSYPAEIDPLPDEPTRRDGWWRHLWNSVRLAWARPNLRARLAESMAFEGAFHGAKDYLQPVLEMAALASVGVAVSLGDAESARATALWVAPVYAALFILAALASLHAHRLTAWAGGEAAASRWLWAAMAVSGVVIAGGGVTGLAVVSIAGFAALHVWQNLWRPILVARLDVARREAEGATLLSIESQTKRWATAVCAPLFGATVDAVASTGADVGVAPVGVCVGFLAAVFFARSLRGSRHA